MRAGEFPPDGVAADAGFFYSVCMGSRTGAHMHKHLDQTLKQQRGISLVEARKESVTEMYGAARETRLPVNNLDRNTYRFSAYVYP